MLLQLHCESIGRWECKKTHLLDDELSSVYALPERHKRAIFYFVHCIGSTGLTMMLKIIYIMKNGTPDTIPFLKAYIMLVIPQNPAFWAYDLLVHCTTCNFGLAPAIIDWNDWLVLLIDTTDRYYWSVLLISTTDWYYWLVLLIGAIISIGICTDIHWYYLLFIVYHWLLLDTVD